MTSDWNFWPWWWKIIILDFKDRLKITLDLLLNYSPTAAVLFFVVHLVYWFGGEKNRKSKIMLQVAGWDHILYLELCLCEYPQNSPEDSGFQPENNSPCRSWTIRSAAGIQPLSCPAVLFSFFCLPSVMKTFTCLMLTCLCFSANVTLDGKTTTKRICSTEVKVSRQH